MNSPSAAALPGTESERRLFCEGDSETTTQNDINLGIVNVVAGLRRSARRVYSLSLSSNWPARCRCSPPTQLNQETSHASVHR
jgi:hypothetical protein